MQSTKKWICLCLAALTLFGVFFHAASGALRFSAAETEATADRSETARTTPALRHRTHTPTMDWLRPGSEMGPLPETPTQAANAFPGAPRDVSGIEGFCPPLFRLTDPIDFEGRGSDADALRFAGADAAFAAAVRETAEDYLSRVGTSLDTMTEVASADPAQLAAGEYTSAAAGLYGGYTLYLRPAETVLVTVSKNEVQLGFTPEPTPPETTAEAEDAAADAPEAETTETEPPAPETADVDVPAVDVPEAEPAENEPAEKDPAAADAPVVEAPALSALTDPAEYGAAIAADPYFTALAVFYGLESPTFTVETAETEERLPGLRFYDAEEDAAQTAVNYYTKYLTVYGKKTEDGAAFGVLPCESVAMGEPAGDFTAYDFAYVRSAADAVCGQNGVSADKLLETSLVRYYDRTGTYIVPAYRFCYLTAEDPAADETLTVFTVDLPAYDLYLYLTTPPTVKGDADNNGVVEVSDARLALRAAVGLEALDWEAVCDMDDDGEFGMSDVRDILRVAVGLPIGEEARRLAEEAHSRRMERLAEEERLSREEESRRIAEEERLSREEESRRIAEEASRKAAEEASRKAAEEASRKAAEEASRRAAEEAKRRAEEEKRNKEKRREDWLASFPNAISYGDLNDNMYWFVNEYGQRNWYSSAQNTMANRIYDRLVGYGYTGGTCKKMDFVRNGITGRNVMAVIPTAKKNPDILLVVSHYDTARGIGGAVDNSSGAVALLQLAKRFKATREDYGIEVRFLFTAGEEQGYFGAYAYVNSLSYAEKSRHLFTFNMDMAGKPNNRYEPGRAYYLAVSTEPVATDGYRPGAARSNVGSRAVDAAKSALGNLGEDGYYSPVRAGVHDIVPFRKAGMPALTLSWRCIASHRSSGADYGLASPYFIHTSEDNLYYFDMNSLYNTTRLAAGAIARLLLPYTNY